MNSTLLEAKFKVRYLL